MWVTYPESAMCDRVYCQPHGCPRIAIAEGPTPANRAGFRFGWRLGKMYSGGPAVALQGSVAPGLGKAWRQGVPFPAA